MAIPVRVLILEDQPADAELMLHELLRIGFEAEWRRVETEADFLAALDPTLDVILADCNLPQYDAMRAMTVLQERGLDIPFIIVTRSVSEAVAVECLRRGAADYVFKDRLARLGTAVAHAVERSRLRKEKREAEEHLEFQGTVLDAAANAVMVTDRSGRIAWVNPAFTRITGYSFSDVWGQTPRLLKSGSHDAAFYQTMWETINAGTVWSGEVVNRRKDGGLYTEEVTITPVRDRDGAITHFIAITTDISARKQAERGLAARTRQLEAIRAVTTGITRELNLPRLLERIIESAVDLADTRSGSLFLWEEPGERLVCVANRGLGDWYTSVRLRPGEGVAGTVAARREGLIVNDYPASPYALRELEAAHPEVAAVRTSLAEPLLFQDRLLGVILVRDRTDGQPFTPEDQGLLRLFAVQAAIAIENARLFHAERERREQVEAVRAISGEIIRELDLTRLLGLITRRAMELARGAQGLLCLWDEPSQCLLPQAEYGVEEWVRSVRFRLGEAVTGTVAQQRRGMLVNDFRHSPFVTPWHLAHTTHTAVVAEPLLYHDRLVGVIAITNGNTGRPFSEQDRETLALFATQAAVAIENARLYAGTQRASREARSLYEVAHSLTTSLNVQGVLDLIVRKTMELLGTAHAQVTLWDEATQRLRLGAVLGTLAEQVRSHDWRLGEGVNGIVADTRAPLVVDDYQSFPHRMPGLTEVTADIGVPLLYRGRLLGVLDSHATEPRWRFTQEHVDLLTSFADQAAVALENARLYEQLQRHAEELEQRVQERTRELAAANRQLQDASRRKSEFLANMSHEIRTPLNSIIGFAELLREQIAGPLTERQARYLTHIWNGGKHLLQLIGDILDLSKAEAGRFILQPEPLPVKETLEDILVIARGLSSKKAQEMQVEIAPDLPPLHADPVRFKQILLNLLSNAVKFTPEHGTITLAARKLGGEEARTLSGLPASQPPSVPAEAWLEIRVTDTGAGIKPADMPRLFQEFVQLETTQAQKHEGSGLGLALTKRLVELHGGRIWAASEGEGRGSTFTVVLPFSRPGAPAEALAGARSS